MAVGADHNDAVNCRAKWQDLDDHLQQQIAASYDGEEDDTPGARQRRRPESSSGEKDRPFVAESIETDALETVNEAIWVETYTRKGRICFRDPGDEQVETKLSDWGLLIEDGTPIHHWMCPDTGRSFFARKLPKKTTGAKKRS